MIFRNFFKKFDTLEKLHRELTKIVYLGREGDQSCYCFCNQRMCFCFIKRKCTLCSFCKILFKHDLIDNMSVREFYQEIWMMERNFNNSLILSGHFFF